MNGDHKYNYEDSGYNGFFRRSIASNPTANNLRRLGNASGNLNFDSMQVSGSMGDSFKVGRINLEGGKGRIDITNENGEVNTRLGELDG